MNERIKELAEQATSLYQTMDGEWEEDFDKEKFAELIVRECAHVAMQYEGDEPSDYNSGRSWAGIDIKKHFGVEL